MRGLKAVTGIAAVLLVVTYLGWKYFNVGRNPSGNVIQVSGNIEITDAEVSFKIPGRVEERLVSEGDAVEGGQIIARLDSRELEQEVAARKAEVEVAEATVSELEAGSRPGEIAQARASVERVRARLDELLTGSRPQEIAAAEAAFQRTQAEAERQGAEYERHQYLFQKGVISEQEYDAARTAYETARSSQEETRERLKLVEEGPRQEQIEEARAALNEVKEHLALVEEGPRQETIAQARAHLQQARALLALAEIRLGYATVPSPLGGIVLSENVEAGEHVAAGTPVVTVGNLRQVWLRAYIDETDLGRVKIGQPARLWTDTYPDKTYSGRVSFIAPEAEFTPKNVQTQKERVKLVYRVKIVVDNPELELKPGMPADADILVDGETSL